MPGEYGLSEARIRPGLLQGGIVLGYLSDQVLYNGFGDALLWCQGTGLAQSALRVFKCDFGRCNGRLRTLCLPAGEFMVEFKQHLAGCYLAAGLNTDTGY